MNMVRKVLTCEVKEVEPRVLEFVGSTERVDRVGDVIECAGWQLGNYKANPVFLWAHRYDQPPIGKATKVWTADNQLRFHIEFAPAETYAFADTIYRLYKGGFLRATSVGFEPKEYEDLETKTGDDVSTIGRRFKKQELLELSACPVPANPEALMNAQRAGLVTVKDIESMTRMAEEHKSRPVSQAELADQLDYTLSLIKQVGIAESLKAAARVLAVVIMNTMGEALPEKRITGSDIPVDIDGADMVALVKAILE